MKQTKIYSHGRWDYIQEGKKSKSETKGIVIFWFVFVVIFLLFVLGPALFNLWIFPAMGI